MLSFVRVFKNKNGGGRMKDIPEEMRKIEFKAWDSEKEMFTNFIIIDNMFKFMDKVTGVWLRDDEQKRFRLLQNRA